jgi:ABC-type branched-subunit amino acid transport system substrate-binding protein
MLSLNARADDRARAAPFVFHVMHSAEARARMLARRAAGAGVKKVAIFAPDSGYGRAVAKAFADVYTAAGGVIVTRIDYKADTKSFADEVTKLKSGWDAVFIPEQADRLGLIAPALDAAGMIPRPLGTRKVKGGHPILVLTTAENAGPDLLHTAGRHLYGAWLACGFYADATDPVISDYVARYLAAFVKAPTALDAYAYDAALVVAKVGAGSRADLAGKLSTSRIVGVTGEVRFDADHRRADDGVLFVVEDDGAGGARVKTVR